MVEIYKSQESGHLEKLTLRTLQKGAWINIVDPTPYELREVSALTQVEPDFLRAALDEEERSHLDVEEDSVMILTNVPIVYEEESYDTLPLAIILTKQHIITVCLEETPVMASFNQRTARLFHTYKRTQFLFEILYRSATFYLRYLRQINKLSDEIEEQLRRSMRNADILRLMELQKGLTYFNASLRSNDAVFEKLLRLRNNRTVDGILEIYEEDEDLLEDV
ncbi:MAG: magnesium transporter CorA family protein, partial [Selenomonadaceae bacterium]|nr:magnesium transporter CorA family protein [Selenomonadaceae bacterium]